MRAIEFRVNPSALLCVPHSDAGVSTGGAALKIAAARNPSQAREKRPA